MSPDENRTLWNSSSASMHETLVALEAAGRASSLWSTTKPPFRHDIFLKAANILDRRAGECKGYMVQEIGAHAHFAQFNLATAAEILRDVAGRISSALSGIVPVCQEQGTHALVVKGPYGVVLGIAPCLISVSNDGEAIAAANDSEYGLSGAVFTRDLDKGLSIAARIETGAVRINGMSIHDEAELPHGGAKKSGWGWFNAQAGLDEFLRTKTITFQTEW
ncbi:hypothetical protein DL762_005556 [Monosporascus cannonballus]|uniref:Aldehyde dehydrogenase domain-containing protein n=1 Tax=Monosporascus cannonballus TaxID=155416 RepID=A0ABY0H7Q1_9PEZI|nr:hypothetical protein DL762_005556 [Monosporascus cannonballus]